MENSTNNQVVAKITNAIAKIQAMENMLATIRTNIEWCYEYDCEASKYTDKVLDADKLKAYEAMYNDLAKLYKFIDC